MKLHLWKGPLPRCVHCYCTSLEAQYVQRSTAGTGPCPLKHDKKLAERLLNEWTKRMTTP